MLSMDESANKVSAGICCGKKDRLPERPYADAFEEFAIPGTIDCKDTSVESVSHELIVFQAASRESHSKQKASLWMTRVLRILSTSIAVESIILSMLATITENLQCLYAE